MKDIEKETSRKRSLHYDEDAPLNDNDEDILINGTEEQDDDVKPRSKRNG